MPEERPESVVRSERLREAFLDYLQAAGFPPWPGADGVTVPDVLLAYAAALAAGQAHEGIERLRDHLVGFALTPEELNGIPEAERAAWRQVWAEATTLLKKVTNARPPSA
jgi:hypothetical protein